MDYTNRRIGEFRIRIQIGEGGFSTIWKGVHISNKDRKAAIKIMKPEGVADKSIKGMFAREWKVVKDLDHPNLLHYLEHGHIGNVPYISMDFFEGRPMRDIITEKSPVLKENFISIFTKLASALGYLHDKCIIHKDIKPENILISDNLDVRLIDFSLAQTKWQRLLDFSRAKIEGSPTYIAPEILRGRGAVMGSDIYALGAVAYEMLTGLPPFMGSSANEVMQKHISELPPNPGKLAKDLDPAIDKLVQSMLAKEPEIRPSGGEDLLRRLKAGKIIT